MFPLDRRLDWPQSRSGKGGEEKISLSLPRIEPCRPAHSLGIILSYSGSISEVSLNIIMWRHGHTSFESP